MFQAVVFMCLMVNMGNCTMVVDQRGPYETEAACMDRVAEMSIAIMRLEHHVPVAFKCKKLDGESVGEQPSSYYKQNLKSPS